MSAKDHKPIKKILCDECKTTDTMHVVLRKEQGGHRIVVVAHRESCKSDKIEFCCQSVYSGGYSSYRYGSNHCGRPVKGHFKGGTHHGSVGVPCCGLHLSHETRQLEKNEAEKSRREIHSYLRDQMDDKIKLIEELTGIVTQLHHRRAYGSDRIYLDTEWILIKADDLIAAIQIEIE